MRLVGQTNDVYIIGGPFLSITYDRSSIRFIQTQTLRVTILLTITKGCGRGMMWGSQSWLRPPFRRPLLVSEVSAWHGKTRSISVVAREAALKGGCSQDWLPHVIPSSPRRNAPAGGLNCLPI